MLLELAERCEKAEAQEQYILLRESHLLVRGLRHYCEPRFKKMLMVEAYESAALRLVPEGWFIYGMGEEVKPIIYKGDLHEHLGFWAEVQRRSGGLLQKAKGRTQALAICAAALRARAASC